MPVVPVVSAIPACWLAPTSPPLRVGKVASVTDHVFALSTFILPPASRSSRARDVGAEGTVLRLGETLPELMLAISSLLATGWISQPLRQRPHRTAAPLRWDEILCGMTQVVTDIDDTIKSSGGVNIGGIALGGVDTSYERNSFYPGVFQFGLELASHTAKPRDPPNKMAVLTARAEVYATAAVGSG